MMSSVVEAMPLRLMRAGTRVEIVEMLGDSSQTRRLHEFGLHPGSCLTVLHAGSPCLVKFGSMKLSFRDTDADTIFVREHA